MNDEARQFSPVQKVGDVAEHLRSQLHTSRWEQIIICKGAEVLKESTWLGTVANDAGEVHLSAARVRMEPADMVKAALERAKFYAGQADWEACCRALSEASSWETEERFAEERLRE